MSEPFVRWLADLARTLPIRSQFVISGNIRDTFLVPVSGQAALVPLQRSLWETLRASGFGCMLVYDPADGIRAYPDEPEPRQLAERLFGLKLAGGAQMLSLESLTSLMRKLTAERQERCALVMDFASRLTRQPSQLAEDEHRFFVVAEKLSLHAAPEAISGVIDAKADYWALGMMLLEMATGAHPFRGLSDAVIMHHLTTRAMDLSGVADARLRKLIGGLLLRDPKRRWDAREINRWLAGDEDLPAAAEQEAEPGFVQPYAVLDERCATPEQLAVAFARHWQAGVADLTNDQLLRWFTEVQKDQNTVRLLLQLRYDSGLGVDEQLLRFILHFVPGIPPIWQGRSIELPALLTQASQALRGDQAAAQWLCQLDERRVLATYAAAGNAQARELMERWNAAAASFEDAWNHCLTLLQKHQTQASDSEQVANFDDLMYGSKAGAPSLYPPPAMLLPRLLAMAYDAAWVERLRGRLARELAVLAVQSPWTAELGDPRNMVPARLLACEALLPEARETAEQQVRRDELRRQQQAQEGVELQAAVRDSLTQIGRHARQMTFLFPDADSLRHMLDEHAGLMARIRAHGATDDAWLAMRRQALSREPTVLRLCDQCHRLSERATASGGWFSGDMVILGFLALFVFAVVFGRYAARLIVAAVMIVAAAITAWRVLPVLHAVQNIHRLGQSLSRRSGNP